MTHGQYLYALRRLKLRLDKLKGQGHSRAKLRKIESEGRAKIETAYAQSQPTLDELNADSDASD
jgi:hypothetical protein